MPLAQIPSSAKLPYYIDRTDPNDIDQGDPTGDTPLMLASFLSHSRIVRILLNKGTIVPAVACDGGTALHPRGHLAVGEMPVYAGVGLEVPAPAGNTTLIILAASRGDSDIINDRLIEAGAKLDSRVVGMEKRRCPLRLMREDTRVRSTRSSYIRAKANPLLPRADHESGVTGVPLDMATQSGHLKVIHELVQQFGIEGCGGASRGEDALWLRCANIWTS